MATLDSAGSPNGDRDAELARAGRGEQRIAERLALAAEQTQEALAEVQRIATEQIRSGLEVSDHVAATERELRSALRQLVLAEREQRSRSQRPASFDRSTDVIGDNELGEEA